jgi:MFS family permease
MSAARPAGVLAATAAVTTACVLPSFLLGAMAVQVRRDLEFDEAGVGVAFATFFATASLASLSLGRLAERQGPVWSLRVAAVVTGGACVGVAAGATTLATLLVPIAVAGASNALCQPAANLLVARALPVDRQGFAFAVKQSAIPAATLLAGAAVPAFALTVGWRWAFVAAGALAVIAVLFVPSAPLPPPVHPADTDVDADGDGASARDVPVAVLARLALGVGLGAASAGSLGSFLVSAAADGGLSEGGAGLLLTAGSLAGISVRLLAGARADRRDGGHLAVVVRMQAAGALAFLLLATTRPAAYLVGGPLAFCTAWAWPGLFNFAVVRANPRRPAAATGITQTGTYVGAVTGPLLFGVIADDAGYGWAWCAAALLALAGAGAMLSGRRALVSWRTRP